MVKHDAVIVKEELINMAVLSQLINNYCTSDIVETIVTLPVESVFIEIDIIKPGTIIVDLKPLIMEQVILAVSKIVKKIEIKSYLDIQNSDEIANFNSNKTQREYVAISSIDEINFIKMDEIMYCRAEGKYTKFFLVNGDTFLSCKNLGDYEIRVLDECHFFRIHNSYIVNMRFVAKVDKRNGLSCELINGSSIPISSRKLDKFTRYIRIKE